MRVLLGFILALSVVSTTSGNARAQTSGALRYEAPADVPSCPSEAELRRVIAAHIGRDPFVREGGLRVDATIRRDGASLRGKVEIWRDGAPVGERDLARTNDCAALATAMALAISVAVDPLVEKTNERSAPLPAPSAAPPSLSEGGREPATHSGARADERGDAGGDEHGAARAAVGTTSAERSAGAAQETGKKTDAAPGARTPLSLELSLGPTASLGLAPAVAAGVAASIGVRSASFSIALGGRNDFPASAPLSIGGRVTTAVTAATLVPCVHVQRWMACLIGAIGSMRAESVGVSVPAVDYGLFAAAGARVGVELPISGAFAVRPHVDALAAISRPSLYLNDRAIWTLPSFSGVLGAELVIRIGGGGF